MYVHVNSVVDEDTLLASSSLPPNGDRCGLATASRAEQIRSSAHCRCVVGCTSWTVVPCLTLARARAIRQSSGGPEAACVQAQGIVAAKLPAKVSVPGQPI